MYQSEQNHEMAIPFSCMIQLNTRQGGDAELCCNYASNKESMECKHNMSITALYAISNHFIQHVTYVKLSEHCQNLRMSEILLEQVSKWYIIIIISWTIPRLSKSSNEIPIFPVFKGFKEGNIDELNSHLTTLFNYSSFQLKVTRAGASEAHRIRDFCWWLLKGFNGGMQYQTNAHSWPIWCWIFEHYTKITHSVYQVVWSVQMVSERIRSIELVVDYDAFFQSILFLFFVFSAIATIMLSVDCTIQTMLLWTPPTPAFNQ